MSIDIPPALQWISYLAGSKWPQGDEDGLWRIGEHWHGAADEMSALIPDLNRVRNETTSVLTGETANTAQQEFAKLFDGDYSVDKLVEAMSALGEMARQAGTQVEASKIEILVGLAMAAAEILYAIAMAPWTFGISMAWIPPIEAITMAAIRALFNALLRALVRKAIESLTMTAVKRLLVDAVKHAAKEAVEEVAEEVATNLAIQEYQISQGHKDGIDWGDVGDAAKGAAAGGAVAGAVHAPVFGGLGGKHGGSGFGNALAGAGASYTAEVAAGIVGAVAVGGDLDAGEILAGGALGGLSGGIESSHGHGHDSHGPGGGSNDGGMDGHSHAFDQDGKGGGGPDSDQHRGPGGDKSGSGPEGKGPTESEKSDAPPSQEEHSSGGSNGSSSSNENSRTPATGAPPPQANDGSQHGSGGQSGSSHQEGGGGQNGSSHSQESGGQSGSSHQEGGGGQNGSSHSQESGGQNGSSQESGGQNGSSHQQGGDGQSNPQYGPGGHESSTDVPREGAPSQHQANGNDSQSTSQQGAADHPTNQPNPETTHNGGRETSSPQPQTATNGPSDTPATHANNPPPVTQAPTGGPPESATTEHGSSSQSAPPPNQAPSVGQSPSTAAPSDGSRPVDTPSSDHSSHVGSSPSDGGSNSTTQSPATPPPTPPPAAANASTTGPQTTAGTQTTGTQTTTGPQTTAGTHSAATTSPTANSLPSPTTQANSTATPSSSSTAATSPGAPAKSGSAGLGTSNSAPTAVSNVASTTAPVATARSTAEDQAGVIVGTVPVQTPPGDTPAKPRPRTAKPEASRKQSDPQRDSDSDVPSEEVSRNDSDSRQDDAPTKTVNDEGSDAPHNSTPADVPSPKVVRSELPRSDQTRADVEQWVGDVNNDGDRSVPPAGERLTNCGPTTWAVFDRLSGTPSFQRAHPAQLRAEDVGAVTGLPLRGSDPDGIDAVLRGAGKGAHTVVMAKFGNGSAHSFNALFDGDGVWAIDGQHGTVKPWPPALGRAGNPVTGWFAGTPAPSQSGEGVAPRAGDDVSAMMVHGTGDSSPTPTEAEPDAVPDVDQHRDGTAPAGDRDDDQPPAEDDRESNQSPDIPPGFSNSKFDDLVNNAASTPRPTKDDYLEGYLRQSVDNHRELSFVVNMIAPHTQIHELPDVVKKIMQDSEGFDGNVAFVVGVNAPNSPEGRAGLDAQLNDPDFRAKLNDLDHPVAVLGSLFNEQAGFKHGVERNNVLHSEANKSVVQAMMAKQTHPYIAIQDFDHGERTTPSGKHIFNYMSDELTIEDVGGPSDIDLRPSRPLKFSGGYRVPHDLLQSVEAQVPKSVEAKQADAKAKAAEAAEAAETDQDDAKKKEEESKKANAVAKRAEDNQKKFDENKGEFLRRFDRAISQDMESRDRQAKNHPSQPYSPEPNLFVDAIAPMVDPSVRFQPAGGEARGLDESLARFNAEELDALHPAPAPLGGIHAGANGSEAVHGPMTREEANKADRAQRPELHVDADTGRHPLRGESFVARFKEGAIATDLGRIGTHLAVEGGVPQTHATLGHAMDGLLEDPRRSGSKYQDFRTQRPNLPGVGREPTNLTAGPNPRGARPEFDPSEETKRSLGLNSPPRYNTAVSAPISGSTFHAGIDPHDQQAVASAAVNTAESGPAASVQRFFGQLANLADLHAQSPTEPQRQTPFYSPPGDKGLFHAVSAAAGQSLKKSAAELRHDFIKGMSGDDGKKGGDQFANFMTTNPTHGGDLAVSVMQPAPPLNPRTNVSPEDVEKALNAEHFVAKALAAHLQANIVVHTGDGKKITYSPFAKKGGDESDYDVSAEDDNDPKDRAVEHNKRVNKVVNHDIRAIHVDATQQPNGRRIYTVRGSDASKAPPSAAPVDPAVADTTTQGDSRNGDTDADPTRRDAPHDDRDETDLDAAERELNTVRGQWREAWTAAVERTSGPLLTDEQRREEHASLTALNERLVAAHEAVDRAGGGLDGAVDEQSRHLGSDRLDRSVPDGSSASSSRPVAVSAESTVPPIHAERGVGASAHEFQGAVDAVVPPGRVASAADCVPLMRKLVERLYDGGVVPLRGSDDAAGAQGGVRGAQDRIVAGGGWAPVHGETGARQLAAGLEVGSTVVVMTTPPGGGVGHVVAGRVTDTGVLWADPQRPGGERMSLEPPVEVKTAASASAVVIDPAGRVRDPQAWPTRSTSAGGSVSARLSPTVDAITDADLTRRFGAHRDLPAQSTPASPPASETPVPPAELPAPDPRLPARSGPNVVLSGMDIVETFDSGNAGLAQVRELVVEHGGQKAWDANSKRLTALFSDDGLRPKVPGMLRGGKPVSQAVELGPGRMLSIDLRLDGSPEVSSLRYTGDVEQYEFEHSSDPNSSFGTLDEGRRTYVGGVQASLTHPNATHTAALLGTREHQWSESNQQTDRQISGGQTTEPATRFGGNVQGVVSYRLSGPLTGITGSSSQTGQKPPVSFHTEVAVPTRAVTDAAHPAQKSDAPAQVARSRALTGSDVVTNLQLLSDDDSASGPRSTTNFVTSTAMRSAFETSYGKDADRAMNEVDQWLNVELLQANLHGMTNKQPLVHHFDGTGGWVEVHAFVESLGTESDTKPTFGEKSSNSADPQMRATGETGKTEFHYGTETDSARVRQDQVSYTAQLPLPGRSRGEGGTSTGEVVGGLDGGLNVGRSTNETTGSQFRNRSTLKNPVAGQAWNGQVRLRFIMHAPGSISPTQRDGAFKDTVVETRAEFDALIEKSENTPITDYTNKKVYAPPARIWHRSRPEDDHNSSSRRTRWQKVTNTYPTTSTGAVPTPRAAEPAGLGSMDRVENLDLSGFHGMLDSMGHRAFGSKWKDVRPTVARANHSNRIRGGLPGMTQHSPLTSTQLSGPGSSTKLSLTADIENLTFSHTIDDVLSSPSMESTEGSATTTISTKQISGQGAVGGRGGTSADSQVLGEVIGGASETIRDSDRVRDQQRFAVATKFHQPMAVFDGWVRIDGTMTGTKATVHESGLFPVRIAIPLTELQGSRTHHAVRPPTFDRSNPTGLVETPREKPQTAPPPPVPAQAPPLSDADIAERRQRISETAFTLAPAPPKHSWWSAAPTKTTPPPPPATADSRPLDDIADRARDESRTTNATPSGGGVRPTEPNDAALEWDPPVATTAPPQPPAHALRETWQPTDMLVGLDPATGLSDAIRSDLAPALGKDLDKAMAGVNQQFGPQVLQARLAHQSGQQWSHDVPVTGGTIRVKVRAIRDPSATYIGSSDKFETDVSVESQSSTAQQHDGLTRHVEGGRVVIPGPHGTASIQVTHSGSKLPKDAPAASSGRDGAEHPNLTTPRAETTLADTEQRAPVRVKTTEAHNLFRQPIRFEITYEKHMLARRLTSVPDKGADVQMAGVFSYPAATPVDATDARHPTLADPTGPGISLAANQVVTEVRPPARAAEPNTAAVQPDSAQGSSNRTPTEDAMATHVLDSMTEEGRQVFGDDWPAVRAELASHVNTGALHGGLGDYSRHAETVVELETVRGGKVVLDARIDAMTAPVPGAAKEAEFYTGGQTFQSAADTNTKTNNWQTVVQGQGTVLPADVGVNASLLGRLDISRAADSSTTRTNNSATGEVFRKKAAANVQAGTATVRAQMSRPTGMFGSGPQREREGHAQIDFRTRQGTPDEAQTHYAPRQGVLADPSARPVPTGTGSAASSDTGGQPDEQHHGLPGGSMVRKIVDGDAFREQFAKNLKPPVSGIAASRLRDNAPAALSDTALARHLPAMTHGQDVELFRDGPLRITGRADLTGLAFVGEEKTGGMTNRLNEVNQGESHQDSVAWEAGPRFMAGPHGNLGDVLRGNVMVGGGVLGRSRHGASYGQGAKVSANAKFAGSYAVFDGTANIVLTVHDGDVSHELLGVDVHGPMLIPTTQVEAVETPPPPPPAVAPPPPNPPRTPAARTNDAGGAGLSTASSSGQPAGLPITGSLWRMFNGGRGPDPDPDPPRRTDSHRPVRDVNRPRTDQDAAPTIELTDFSPGRSLQDEFEEALGRLKDETRRAGDDEE